MLVGRGHDLVARLEAEAADDDRAALGGGARERHLRRIGVDEARERLTGLVPQRDRLLEVRHAASAVLGVVLDRLHERVHDGARERRERARIEVRDPLQDGRGAGGPPRTSRRLRLDASLDDGVVGEHDAILHAPLARPRDDGLDARATHQDLIDPVARAGVRLEHRMRTLKSPPRSR